MAKPLRALASALVAVVQIGAWQAARSEPEPVAVANDGLVRVDSERFQAVWLRPGCELSGYSKLLVLPAQVHYKRPPEKSRAPKENFALSNEHMEALTTALREGFDQEIVAKGGWELAEQPASGVLLARGGLIDLVVNVPPPRGPVDPYLVADSFGEATLVFELYDSLSMEILLRILDRHEVNPRIAWIHGQSRGRLTTSPHDIQAAKPHVKRMLERWATRLREELDLLRGSARTP